MKITNEEVLVAVVKRHESTSHYNVLNFINRVTQLLQLERERERERERESEFSTIAIEHHATTEKEMV